MDKKKLYEKAERALNQAFESAKHSVKVVSEKAGEAAHVTRLLIEKATLEHKVSKKFAEIGSRVYEKISRDEQSELLKTLDVAQIVEDTKKLDAELSQVEATLEQERRKTSKV